MTTLRFDATHVKRLVDHALAAHEHQACSGRACGPALFFVKDEGIYLMSNGKPPLMPSGDKADVAYATGYDPTRDDDVWARSRVAVGGDDFAEALPADSFEPAFEAGATTIHIRVTAKTLEVAYT